MKLEEIIPYLPYGLEVIHNNSGEKYRLLAYWQFGAHENDNNCIIYGYILYRYPNIQNIKNFTPILRPKSTITDEWLSEINCDLSAQIELKDYAEGLRYYSDLPYRLILVLLENHIDIFGLIEKGEAIDFNTLK